MLSLVSFIAPPSPLGSIYTPCTHVSTDDPSLSIAQLGRSRFRAFGTAYGMGSTSVQMRIDDESVHLPLNPQEAPRDWSARLQQMVPSGYCLISRPQKNDACELIVLKTQNRAHALPEAKLIISSDHQTATNLRANVLEIQGTAVQDGNLLFVSARLTLDSHQVNVPLPARATPLETARAVSKRLPAGYHAVVEPPRGPGLPARISFWRDVEDGRAAA